MKIRTRLTLNFTLLVACILVLFSLSVILFYKKHRETDFTIRLRNRAINTASMLFEIKGMNTSLMKSIDDRTLTNMKEVSIIIADENRNIKYCNKGDEYIGVILRDFQNLNWDNNEPFFLHKKLQLCVKQKFNNKNYYILASAYDIYGATELEKLITILCLVFVFSLLVIWLTGLINARQSLKPLKDLVYQVNDIKANKLNKRLELFSKDEVAELAAHFNNMLDRIEVAFEHERMFVSNASHELRTPITSIKGQIEVGLINDRTTDEYKGILQSILEDIENMATIINGFLELAHANIEIKNIVYEQIRVDEILFQVKEDILKRKPEYNIVIDYDKMPSDEDDINIWGNVRLIKIMLTNIIDNACKFSDNKKVVVKINFDKDYLILKFVDNGIGIPQQDFEKISRPLFRGSNVNGHSGHGIGLSIVKRIAEIHFAKTEIISELNVGTTVTLTFKHNALR